MASVMRPGIAFSVVLALAVIGYSSSSQARDFFSTFFGAFTGGSPPVMSPPSVQLPFGTNVDETRPPSPARSGSGRTAYCVRTCDGRYFPIARVEGDSRAAVCNSFCPASETKVFYGGSIDDASTENGKSYSDLPNAYRYRNEMVTGCTCNGKDTVGLAAIKIEDDLTLRKGDIVAGPNGMSSATGHPDKHAANFTPVSRSMRSGLRRLPVVAEE